MCAWVNQYDNKPKTKQWVIVANQNLSEISLGFYDNDRTGGYWYALDKEMDSDGVFWWMKIPPLIVH